MFVECYVCQENETLPCNACYFMKWPHQRRGYIQQNIAGSMPWTAGMHVTGHMSSQTAL